MAELPVSLVLVGAGKMGGAMLAGWLKLGLPGGRISVLDPDPAAEIQALCRTHGVKLNPPGKMIANPQAMVLAVKPQALDHVAADLTGVAGPATLIISVIAGKTVADLRQRLPTIQCVVRAMPNTAAAVGRGITGAWANSAVSDVQRRLADALLTAIGRLEWVTDEALIDAVTALSGSGPAYVFYLCECMAKAGEAVGLPADLADRLARATVEGAGELLFQAAASPATLRQNVTSPAGTTAAALDVLMAPDGMQPLIIRAVAAAKRRAGDLSG